MPSNNFDPVYSTDNIYREQDQTRSLSDDLTNIETDITALENGKANANHTHTEYAEINHVHTDYASSNHSHTGYASVEASNEFDGEQKFKNSQYCGTLNDTANGVGCAFKASRVLMNEALVDKLIITGTTGQMPIYVYTGVSDGSFSGLVRVGYIDSSGNAVFNGTVSASNIQDGVINNGVYGNLRYQKWNSGKSEAWYSEYFGDVSLTTSIAGGVWSNELYYARSVSLPSGLFVEAPIVTSNVCSNGYTCSQVSNVGIAQVVYRIWSPYSASVTGCSISIYMVGRWK